MGGAGGLVPPHAVVFFFATKGPGMEFEHIRVSVVNHVGWLEYDRPPINAFHWEMTEEARLGLDGLIADPEVRVIVVASALEDHFSVGAELATFDGITPGEMSRWVDLVQGMGLALRNSPKPVLAAIHGLAVGGGLEITLHCDIRFAAADARFGQPEINIGFIPPVATTQTLARLLGRSRAIRYLYEGVLISAPEAQDIGLVDVLHAPKRLRKEVQLYGETLAQKPPEALEAIRKTITEGMDMPFAEGMALEKEWAVRLAGTGNFREGIRAFLEKRDPVWEWE